MRRLLAVSVCALAVVGHAGAVRGEDPAVRAAQEAPRAECACQKKCKACAKNAPKAEGRQYSVTCRVVDEADHAAREGKQLAQLVVAEGARAMLGTSQPGTCEEPKQAAQPKAAAEAVRSEDTSIELMVTPLGGSRVQLDARVEKRMREGADAAECPFQPSERAASARPIAESSTHVRRSIRAISLGETVAIPCGCKCCDGESSTVILLTVHEVDPLTPAITPIIKASAESEASGSQFSTRVYSVADLLEPYAMHKEGPAVETVDFLPIIDTLLTESGCNWPAEARIRPMTENVALVITQTAEGHQAIANLLSAKRASVDVLKEQMLRR